MKNINFKYQIAAGVTLLLVGTLLLFSNYIKDKRDVVFSEMNLVLSSMDIPVVEEPVEEVTEVVVEESEQPEEVVEQPVEEPKNDYTYEEYLGILDIPKIKLYKGFYNKTSKLNNVNINLYVLPVSANPDVERGNLIIAGHYGNRSNSYFRNLYLLEVGDDIIIHYNNKKYLYTITKIYLEEKDGSVRIIRDNSKTTLTLITCTKDDNNHQTIYISELKGVE